MKKFILILITVLIALILLMSVAACTGTKRIYPKDYIPEPELDFTPAESTTAMPIESNEYPESINGEETETPLEDITETEIPTETPVQEPSEPTVEDIADIIVESMTLDELISQMFFITLEDITPDDFIENRETLINYLNETNAGGYILLPHNISSYDKTKAFNDEIRTSTKIRPFIGIEEESNQLSCLTEAKMEGYNAPQSAFSMSGNTKTASDAGKTIGSALISLSINVNFAPVADIKTNPENNITGERTYGSDANTVSDMVSSFMTSLNDSGVMGVIKHFPGHGETVLDPANGYVLSDADETRLNDVEYKPFVRAINEGAKFIMAGHIIVPNVDNSGYPASLSSYFLTDVLKNQLGFKNIIITDSMSAEVISNKYTSGEAAVMAVLAGADMIVTPENYDDARTSLSDAVRNGTLTQERIKSSVRRILAVKLNSDMIKSADFAAPVESAPITVEPVTEPVVAETAVSEENGETVEATEVE